MRAMTLFLLLAAVAHGQAVNNAASFTGDLEFISGYEAGMAEAKFTGRPAMLFFVKQGEDKCKVWSGTAFKDTNCKKTLENYVLVIIDGEAEPEARKKFPSKGYPFVKFVNAAGERLCEIWESATPTVFEMAAGRGLGKHGQIRYSATYAREVIAADRIETALPLKEFREAIRCIAEIEKINHAGKLLTRAQVVKGELQAEARKRIAAAQQTQASNTANAKLALAAVAREFAGLPEATEADGLARKLKP